MWWEPGAVPLAAHEHRPRVVFRIRIGRVTGRRAEPDLVKTMPGRAGKRGGSRWLTQVLAVCCGDGPSRSWKPRQPSCTNCSPRLALTKATIARGTTHPCSQQRCW